MANRYLALSPRQVEAQSRFGATFVGSSQNLIDRYIYLFGVWEPQVTEWIRRCLSPGEVFLDIGANNGYYSLLASGLVGDDGEVIAIEASPRMFAELTSNLERNHVQNVRGIKVALSNETARLKIYSGPTGNLGMSTVV